MLIQETEMWKKYFSLQRKFMLQKALFFYYVFDFLGLYNSFHLRKKKINILSKFQKNIMLFLWLAEMSFCNIGNINAE